MKVIKGETIDVRLTTEEFATLIGLHQELVDRGLCPESKIGDQRDFTELDKYLEFLPRSSQEKGSSLEAKIVCLPPNGERWLEITGLEAMVSDIPEQLKGASWFDTARPIGSAAVTIRCLLNLNAPSGAKGSP